jgi:hypothetical protein
MSKSILEQLEKQLKKFLGEAVPNQAVYDIHAAMELAMILETKGFTFQLKDLCPKSMDETAWRAIFFKDKVAFATDHPESSVSVCKAAVDALASSFPEKKENIN